MNYRKYINNPESLLKEGRAIMSASDDSKYLFRVFAVNMVLSGCTVEYVAEMGGVSKASVSNWVKSADENGFESLRNKRIPGRPSRLNDEQKAAIDLALQSNPDDYGFKIWNGSSLSEYIKNIFNRLPRKLNST